MEKGNQRATITQSLADKIASALKENECDTRFLLLAGCKNTLLAKALEGRTTVSECCIIDEAQECDPSFIMLGCDFDHETVMGRHFDTVVLNIPNMWHRETIAEEAIGLADYENLILIVPDPEDDLNRKIEGALEKRDARIRWQEETEGIIDESGKPVRIRIMLVRHISRYYKNSVNSYWMEKRFGKPLEQDREDVPYTAEAFERLIRNSELSDKRIIESYEKRQLELERAMHQIMTLGKTALTILTKNYSTPNEELLCIRFMKTIRDNRAWHWNAFDTVLLQDCPALDNIAKQSIVEKLKNSRDMVPNEQNMRQRRAWFVSLAENVKPKMLKFLFSRLCTKESTANIHMDDEKWKAALDDPYGKFRDYRLLDQIAVAEENGTYIRTGEIVLENSYTFARTYGKYNEPTEELKNLFSSLQACAQYFGIKVLGNTTHLPEYAPGWNVSVFNTDLVKEVSMKAFKNGTVRISLSKDYVDQLNRSMAEIRKDTELLKYLDSH